MKTRHLHKLWITKASLLGYTVESFGSILTTDTLGMPYNKKQYVLLNADQHYVCSTSPGAKGYLEPVKFNHVWQAAEYALKLQGVDPYEENLQ